MGELSFFCVGLRHNKHFFPSLLVFVYVVIVSSIWLHISKFTSTWTSIGITIILAILISQCYLASKFFRCSFVVYHVQLVSSAGSVVNLLTVSFLVCQNELGNMYNNNAKLGWFYTCTTGGNFTDDEIKRHGENLAHIATVMHYLIIIPYTLLFLYVSLYIGTFKARQAFKDYRDFENVQICPLRCIGLCAKFHVFLLGSFTALIFTSFLFSHLHYISMRSVMEPHPCYEKFEAVTGISWIAFGLYLGSIGIILVFSLFTRPLLKAQAYIISYFFDLGISWKDIWFSESNQNNNDFSKELKRINRERKRELDLLNKQIRLEERMKNAGTYGLHQQHQAGIPSPQSFPTVLQNRIPMSNNAQISTRLSSVPPNILTGYPTLPSPQLAMQSGNVMLSPSAIFHQPNLSFPQGSITYSNLQTVGTPVMQAQYGTQKNDLVSSYPLTLAESNIPLSRSASSILHLQNRGLPVTSFHDIASGRSQSIKVDNDSSYVYELSYSNAQSCMENDYDLLEMDKQLM